MPKITLTGAAFHGFEFTVGPKRGEGAPIVIAKFSAPWTERNREAGGWEELPESVSGSIDLVPGELAASTMEFIPGNGMETHAISMAVASASDFKCFVPTKEDDKRELRFKIRTPSLQACHDFETWGRLGGDATGRLKISYNEPAPPTQGPLFTKEQTADNAKTN